MTTTIYSPVAGPEGVAVPVLTSGDVQGRVVGFLDNRWPSWQTLLGAFECGLLKTRGTESVLRWDVPLTSAPPAETLADAAKRSDLTVVGLGH